MATSLFGKQQVVLEKGLEQDAAHLAGTQNGDAQVGKSSRLDREFVCVSAHSLRLPECRLLVRVGLLERAAHVVNLSVR